MQISAYQVATALGLAAIATGASDYQAVVSHYIGKTLTQRNERTNGILQRQIGRWHRRQNKFGKVWRQTQVTARLVLSYFNRIWQHSQLKMTAARRAKLTNVAWSWSDLVIYPTLL